MKPGRNQPCPCGSGRKYKFCCLRRPEPVEPIDFLPPADTNRVRSAREVVETMESRIGPNLLTPYVTLRMVETPPAGDNALLQAAWESGRKASFTIRGVAAMSTEEIQARLGKLGIDASHERFLSLARGRESAWTISDVWRREANRPSLGKEEDFLGLAACTLWSRWLPDRPSMEMLDDWMQEGYDRSREGDGRAACEIWWEVWCRLRPKFRPEMTTMLSTIEAFQGFQSVFNWTQRFETELRNASRHGLSFAAVGCLFCEEWIEQFPDEGGSMQVGFHTALAEFLSRLGRGGEARDVLEAFLERWPGEPWGYVGAADAYSHYFPGFSDFPRDPERAIELLRTALALPGLEPYQREAVEDRIRQVRDRREGGAPR